MKAVELLVESLLPPGVRKAGRQYTQKDLNEILAETARKYPERFTELQSKLADTGRDASYTRGETIGLEDLAPVFDKQPVLMRMDAEIIKARKEARNPDEFKEHKNEIINRYSQEMEQLTMSEGKRMNNPIVRSVASGARGKAAQAKAMLATPGVYTDTYGNTVPFFIRHSFAEGLRPSEFAASTFGSRLSVVSTKNATAKGGDLSKIAQQTVAGLLVTKKDCGTKNGVDVDVDDDSIRYRVLAKAVAGYPAGTLIDGRVQASLRAHKVGDVIVRSPLTCHNEEGICSKCAGAYFTGGKLPHVGDHAGLTATQSIFEPVTQMALNTKHTSGIAGAKKTYSGLEVLSQIVQSPDHFPDRATVAETAGTVDAISKAPQGGHIIHIAGQEHYVPTDYDLMVKAGDKVEAGDQLSDGVVDAKDILRLQGLGAARLHYATRFKQALDDSGIKTNRQATEMLARAALDHVVVDDADGVGDFLPDDVTSYNKLIRSYHLPKDAKELAIDDAHGHYLQHDALHFTVGTKLTPKMTGRLKKAGYEKLLVSDEEPGFRAEMPRLRVASHSQDDWLAKQSTSYLAGNLENSAVRGETTDIKSNIHYAPRLSVGEGFGANIHLTGKF